MTVSIRSLNASFAQVNALQTVMVTGDAGDIAIVAVPVPRSVVAQFVMVQVNFKNAGTSPSIGLEASLDLSEQSDKKPSYWATPNGITGLLDGTLTSFNFGVNYFRFTFTDTSARILISVP